MIHLSQTHSEIEPSPAAMPAGYLGPAEVVEINERDRLVLVRWQRGGEECLSWSRPAMFTPAPLKAGDVALMLSQNLEDFYLVGLLMQSSPEGEAKSGATVVVERRLESGKTTIHVEEGDLEFVTQNGSIAFRSAHDITFAAPRLETQAETVVSTAKNSYQTVEELSQLETGRMRTLVSGSCHLKARDAFLKADEDFKVDGKQIHLG